MTIQFKVDSTYTLGSIKLICTYIEDNTVWLVHRVNPLADVVDCVHYKLNKKTDKSFINSIWLLVRGILLITH